MQGLVHAMQTQAQTTAVLQAQAPGHEAVFRGVPMMERFRRMTPPFFKGESDPILEESWHRETEKIFRAIRCAEEEKVTLDTYMLQERADVWWSSVLLTQFADGAMERAVRLARVATPTPGRGTVVEKPVCTQCGKRHGGEVCWVTSGRCLRCGDKNHNIKDCPKMAQQTAAAATPAAARLAQREAGRPRAQARVSHVGGGLEQLNSKERDYLAVKVGIFELRFITPVGGKEASYMGVQFRI
ncbi:hypothetical protein Taro_052793 [Colocasia esculenta]|uniref:CCHC-type domain-containing protein n=1 Tax=Colocasia esculenta TaxID=4460 RepID=A0A843XKR0_COLES|nr:hypothetical protein [Colocasia esculenta]